MAEAKNPTLGRKSGVWKAMGHFEQKVVFPTKKREDGGDKNPVSCSETGFSLRGNERIRTAVRGFADLCLATRPPDH